VSADLADRFYRDTGGNPLFIIETARAAETAGDARRQLDTHKSASALVNVGSTDEIPVPIPPKVHSVIQSRLARLTPAAQILTQVAATIGRAFDVALLAQAANQDEGAVLTGLDELWQRRIIREYDRGRFDFSHDRIRDVAYAMINPVKHRLLHRQVAKALERIYGADTDPVAEELAVHCQRADAFKQALAYFRQAADAAKRVYAHAKVVENLQKTIAAVQMLPAAPENKEIEINLWYDLGLAEIRVHDWGSEPVGAAWNRAYELAMQTNSVSLRGRAFLALQTLHGSRGQLRKALEVSRLALSLAQDSADPFLMINVFAAYGGNLYHVGQPEPAIEYLAKVRSLAEHDIPPSFEWFSNHPEINAHIRLAKALWLLEQPDRAKLLCDEAIATNSANEDWLDQFAVLDYSAMLYSFLRDEDTVLQLGEALLELSTKYDYPFYQRAGQMFIGWARAHKGDAKTGAKQVRESMNGHRDRGIRKFEPYWRSLLAETLALAGEIGEALSELELRYSSFRILTRLT
jgi:tetratricopeptide (TPR) repeat protein